MPKLCPIPSYRHHKSRNLAVVRIDGKDHYLGPYGSPESQQRYRALILEFLSGDIPPEETGQSEDAQIAPPDDLPELWQPQDKWSIVTVDELIDAYVRLAKQYYRKNGKLTREAEMIAEACQCLRRAGLDELLVIHFGPKRLKEVRETMIANGLSRGHINKQIGRIRRMFRWGVEDEMVRPDIAAALAAVRGLAKGRTSAKETSPVKPVSEADVEATIPYLPETVADMVRLQQLTGMRPGEVVQLRPGDIDRTSEVWEYRPASHKTEHHGHTRVVYFGPKAQDVLRKYLLRPGDLYSFSPKESEKRRRKLAHEARTTVLSCGNRPGSNRKTAPKRLPGQCYTRDSYRRSIARACEKAGIPKWTPHQLRHSAATAIRKEFGLEAAQVILGHSSADVTQVYAERDAERARAVMLRIG